MNVSYFEELRLGFYGIGNDDNDTDAGSIYPSPTPKLLVFTYPLVVCESRGLARIIAKGPKSPSA